MRNRALLLAISALLAACASAGPKQSDDVMHAVRALPPDAAPPTVNDGMPAGFRALFLANDARARAILYHQQCFATVIRLRASGTFGAPAVAPKLVYCERTADGVPIGGVFDVDSAFTQPRRLALIRLDVVRVKFTDAIDTVRVVREAKLLRDISREFTPIMRKQARAFTVAPYSPSVGVSEGWVLQVAGGGARTGVLGGDIGVVRDGAGVLHRNVDELSTRRVVTIPASGIVALASGKSDVPSVSDLVLARSLAERGRDVVVSTKAMRSTLVRAFDPGSGSRFSWEHVKLVP